MMESIEKLRESLKDCTSKAGIEPNQFDTYWITARACDMLIDEIEREIAVKYMELPLDADGVPIKLGDRIKCTDTPTSRTFIVLAIGKTKGGNPVFHGYEEKGDHLEHLCHLRVRIVNLVDLVQAVELGHAALARPLNLDRRRSELALAQRFPC